MSMFSQSVRSSGVSPIPRRTLRPPAWACLHPGFQGTGLFQDVRTDPASTSSPPLTLSWPTDQLPHSFSRAAVSFPHVCRRLFVLWLSSRTYAIASSSYRIPMQSRNACYDARYPFRTCTNPPIVILPSKRTPFPYRHSSPSPSSQADISQNPGRLLQMSMMTHTRHIP